MSNIGLASNFVTDASSSFKMLCLSLLDIAYAEVFAAKKVDREWDENAVTEVLVCSMNENPVTISRHITAITEKRLLPENLVDSLPSVDSAYRIDIKIGGFGWNNNKEYRVEYFMEAKNLYCQSFMKANNTRLTSHTHYVQRYINTGIGNLLDGHYPSDTLLLGYVLVGTVSCAINLLNDYLTKASRNRETISVRQQSYFPHLEMGQSNHPHGMMIEHCFLAF